MKRRELVVHWLGNGVLLIYLAFCLFPIYWIFLTSIKTPTDVIAYPPKFTFTPTWENYVQLLFPQGLSGIAVSRTDFVKALQNTLIVAGAATLISMVTGTLAAFSLARFRFFAREGLAFLILSFRFIPEISLVLPIYLLFQRTGLYNTYTGLIIAYQLISLPILVWVLRGYFESIPVELDQAAQVDGCSWLGSFVKIYLPLAAPGIAATTIIAFIFAWNNFTLGLMLSGHETRTLTVTAVSFMSYEQVLWGQMAGAAILTLLPVVVFALFVQRWIIQGLTFGAVKG